MGRSKAKNQQLQPEHREPVGSVGLDQVSHSYAGLDVFEDFSLDISPREVVGLVGPSGCGKSTLLELIAGLQHPTGGVATVAGCSEASERLKRCAYMPQQDLLMPWMSAIDNAALAIRNQGKSRRSARAAAAPLFRRFGLEGFEDFRPAELSGGMAQRVAFLRTLLSGKPVLLLDEPFAALDAITRGEMQSWLADALFAEPRTVIMVSHDVEEALYLCDRVLVLSKRPGRIVREISAPSPRAQPREETVTSPGFALMRERAMIELREGSRDDDAPDRAVERLGMLEELMDTGAVEDDQRPDRNFDNWSRDDEDDEDLDEERLDDDDFDGSEAPTSGEASRQ